MTALTGLIESGIGDIPLFGGFCLMMRRHWVDSYAATAACSFTYWPRRDKVEQDHPIAAMMWFQLPVTHRDMIASVQIREPKRPQTALRR